MIGYTKKDDEKNTVHGNKSCERGKKCSQRRDKKKIKNTHPMLPPCVCKRKCFKKLSEERRRPIHTEYWEKGRHLRQEFISIRGVNHYTEILHTFTKNSFVSEKSVRNSILLFWISYISVTNDLHHGIICVYWQI